MCASFAHHARADSARESGRLPRDPGERGRGWSSGGSAAHPRTQCQVLEIFFYLFLVCKHLEAQQVTHVSRPEERARVLKEYPDLFFTLLTREPNGSRPEERARVLKEHPDEPDAVQVCQC